MLNTLLACNNNNNNKFIAFLFTCKHNSPEVNYRARVIKLRGFSPPANYNDRATAACRRSFLPTLADRGCHVVSATNPHGR
jgi:hypothetical protein